MRYVVKTGYENYCSHDCEATVLDMWVGDTLEGIFYPEVIAYCDDEDCAELICKALNEEVAQ